MSAHDDNMVAVRTVVDPSCFYYEMQHSKDADAKWVSGLAPEQYFSKKDSDGNTPNSASRSESKKKKEEAKEKKKGSGVYADATRVSDLSPAQSQNTPGSDGLIFKSSRPSTTTISDEDFKEELDSLFYYPGLAPTTSTSRTLRVEGGRFLPTMKFSSSSNTSLNNHLTAEADSQRGKRGRDGEGAEGAADRPGPGPTKLKTRGLFKDQHPSSNGLGEDPRVVAMRNIEYYTPTPRQQPVVVKKQEEENGERRNKKVGVKARRIVVACPRSDDDE